MAFARGSNLIHGDGGAYEFRGATGPNGRSVMVGYNADSKIYYSSKTLTPRVNG